MSSGQGEFAVEESQEFWDEEYGQLRESLREHYLAGGPPVHIDILTEDDLPHVVWPQIYLMVPIVDGASVIGWQWQCPGCGHETSVGAGLNTKDRAPSASSPDTVYACAIIERDNQVLLLRRPGGDWALPLIRLRRDRPILGVLDYCVREIVGFGVESASLRCTIKDREGLVLVFDTVLDNGSEPRPPKPAPGNGPPYLVWTDRSDLDSLPLWPPELHETLAADAPSWHSLPPHTQLAALKLARHRNR